MRLLINLAVLVLLTGKALCNTGTPTTPSILDVAKLIKEGKIEQALKDSTVEPSKFAGLKSYSAYMGVGLNKTWYTHFWFFPNEKKPLATTPWIIWLEGGPARSSSYGIFEQIGPLQYVNGTVSRMETTWASNYSLLFIDAPSGAGYSFAPEPRIYMETDEEVGENLRLFLELFVQMFPDLQKAPLFITGHTYGAKFASHLGFEIHQNWNKSVALNLTGIITANALIDVPMMYNYSELGIQWGFWDLAQGKIFADLETELQNSYKKGDMAAYKNLTQRMDEEIWSYVPNPYNVLIDNGKDYYKSESNEFLKREDVMKALHVVGPYEPWSKEACGNLTSLLLPAKEKFEVLVQNYPVLAYAGQVDFLYAPVLADRFHLTLNWKGAEYYRHAHKKAINTKHKGRTLDIIGFSKGALKFREVMVRAAGQMAAREQPLAVMQLVDSFVGRFA